MTEHHFLILALIIGVVHCGHQCIHDHIMPENSIIPRTAGITHSKRAAPGPMRILFNTDALTNDPDRLCESVGQVRTHCKFYRLILKWAKIGELTTGSSNNPTPICDSDWYVDYFSRSN
jgi:hypothetical protein